MSTWELDFYEFQDRVSGVYTTPIGPGHFRRAYHLQAIMGPRPREVLELGAGGGQTAAAISQLGHRVTALDINPRLIAHAQELASDVAPGTLTAVVADLYGLKGEASYDGVCYYDGFGLRDDADQRTLMSMIDRLLRQSGVAVIDVYQPGYWKAVSGLEVDLGTVRRRYEYDARGKRLQDTWRITTDPAAAHTQTLRCYDPEEFRLLLEGTTLVLDRIEPGGALAGGAYYEPAPISAAMTYRAVLRKPDG